MTDVEQGHVSADKVHGFMTIIFIFMEDVVERRQGVIQLRHLPRNMILKLLNCR